MLSKTLSRITLEFKKSWGSVEPFSARWLRHYVGYCFSVQPSLR